ncbi:LytTR family DNA-binding domain-containing protein [Brevundimonas sp. Root1423]|uniref:LytTR family DNA-binding domain-containing protein n=1 Tax=Brevundimonas sp. Root1423 TaxID=1736462 RepID=UPI0006F4C224|nr:LytTR family DNA-binding domain-containing protein [Brevundimonas sp. Root1423]KQY75453.1 hypothetical protein ASD25_13035 [Brevundimonas sp. Root1423]
MSDTPNTARVWAIELAVCLATGALMGVIGPFGSFFNDVLAVRIAYWVSVFLICGVTLRLAIRVLAPRARRAGVPVWAWAPAMVLALGLPLAGITRMIAIAIWPGIRQGVSPVDWYGQTVLVILIYGALHATLVRRLESPASPQPVKTGAPHILRHLPPRLGSDLLCLSMEDHYVRLHTERGSVLVLMSLGQALDELGDLDGLQVHRSWWVARRAVDAVIEDGRNLRLRLKGGIEAPVSRASVARLRSAGWLDGRAAGET